MARREREGHVDARVLANCANLKAMYLARCNYVDDWFLSRLAHDFDNQLLFLDLSGCPSVGVTGILALTRLKYVSALVSACI